MLFCVTENVGGIKWRADLRALVDVVMGFEVMNLL
jgi:hypothetical protein